MNGQNDCEWLTPLYPIGIHEYVDSKKKAKIMNTEQDKSIEQYLSLYSFLRLNLIETYFHNIFPQPVSSFQHKKQQQILWI